MLLAYQLRIAWKSLRRNPVLSSLLIVGIALGIAVATTFVTAYYLMGKNPLPGKSETLHYVQIDAWNPDSEWDSDRPEEPPNQLTFRDATTLLASDVPARQTVNFRASLTVHPADDAKRPFRAETRVCTADFFTMFEVPFAHGGPWSPATDGVAEPVVVLDHAINLRLFGGENSVGQSVRIEDREFTVTGVLAPWRPTVKFYDTNNNDLGPPEEIYVPFSLTRPMEIESTGNSQGWKFYAGNEFEDFLESETIWLQMWVELPDRERRETYEAYLAAYVGEQKALGRHERPLNNRLRTLTEWLDHEEVVPDEAKTLLIVGLLFLVVCSVNLIGILLGKFLARAPEVGVRRALGASRRSVFVQHLLECELIGILGGTAGLGLSWVALQLINRMFAGVDFDLQIDPAMVGAAFALSLFAGLLAGIYPSWRVCRVAPATYLKLQ